MNEFSVDLDTWADAYITYHSAGPDVSPEERESFWAFERFMIIDDLAKAEEAWKGMLMVLDRKPDEFTLACLSASLLEDIVHDFGKDFIDRIERAASDNPSFRSLLTGIWKGGCPDVWARVQQAVSGN